MRTLKWSAFLSGLCVTAVVLGIMTADARADVTIEKGASILAFPKVLADGGTDTLIQITNVSNSMVHARCFYVNAQLPRPNEPENPLTGNVPFWQETDFNIWLTKQQPTHWLVSTGRFVNPLDNCFDGNQIDVEECENAGIDPGAVPPVPPDFVGELKCIEVDAADVPIGGNHFKGEATLKSGGDVAKYNAIGLEATEFAGETGNTLLLNWPKGVEPEEGQQYSACPAKTIVNHIAEGATDPVILANFRGGTCFLGEEDNEAAGGASGFNGPIACQDNCDCPLINGATGGGFGLCGECELGPQIQDAGGAFSLRSATVNDLTIIPCQEDFENQIPGRVKIQFRVFNEFEQVFSASTSVVCWKNFRLFEVDSRNDPENSVFSFSTLGTTAAKTELTPEDPTGSFLAVHGTLRADRDGQIARTLQNVFIEGDFFTATDGQIIDEIILPEP
jgi:hypothetical protein